MPNLRRTLSNCALVHAGDFFAVDVDFAGIGVMQADEMLEQNALAAAAGADNARRPRLFRSRTPRHRGRGRAPKLFFKLRTSIIIGSKR